MSPWWIVGTFVVTAIAAAAGLPEPAAAGILALAFVLVVARHPANGVAAIVLASPFLLGEQKTPYFLLAHLAAAVVAFGFVAHWLRDRAAFVPRHGVPALVFLTAAIVAVPLNLRDLLEDLWLFRSLDWSRMLVDGVPDISHLKYLERIVITALGMALFAVASQPAMSAGVVRAMVPLAVVTATVSGFGLLRFFGLVGTSGQYLTTSFWTWAHPDLRLTAVAWNPDYLAQWLVLALPLVAGLLWRAGSSWQRVTAVGAVGLGATAVVFTFQRAAYIALAIAALVLVALVGRARPDRGSPLGLLVGASVLLVAVGLLDALLLHGRVVGRLLRLADDPNRVRLWETALRMWAAHPLLGVGTGRYAFFFPEYAGELARGFGPFWGTAHSLYLHVAAEQGTVGLVGFLLLFGGVWARGYRRLAGLSGDRAVQVAALLAALAGWLTYGLLQYTFRVDGLVYLACILAGTTVALTPLERPVRRARRWHLVAAGVVLLVLTVRVGTVLHRPVSPGYEAGFYRWERQDDGTPGRWTRGRAAMSVPVRGRVMALRLRAPIPGVERRPQVVRVWADRELVAEIRLAGSRWETVQVPVRPDDRTQVLLELAVDHTFVPARLTGSRDRRRLGVMIGEIGWPG